MDIALEIKFLRNLEAQVVTMIEPAPRQLERALSAYGIDAVEIQPLAEGLINRTWHVRDRAGEKRILQAVNAMFPPEVHQDIDRVTRHLEKSGLRAPRLLPTREGALFHREGNQLWRVFNYLEGRVCCRLEALELAGAAGLMLGRAQAALQTFDGALLAPWRGGHDVARHLRHLENTLNNRQNHKRHALLKPLGETILAEGRQLPNLPAAPQRLVHGDPKISNFIFSWDGLRVEGIVDFDTLSRMLACLETGDALRSWCNPAGEDAPDGQFSTSHCRAALEGYAVHASGFLTEPEWRGIPPAALTIAVELAARFCADALNEDFFSWNADEFDSHSEHSEVRARGQLSVARAIQAQYAEISAMTEEIFGN